MRESSSSSNPFWSNSAPWLGGVSKGQIPPRAKRVRSSRPMRTLKDRGGPRGLFPKQASICRDLSRRRSTSRNFATPPENLRQISGHRVTSLDFAAYPRTSRHIPGHCGASPDIATRSPAIATHPETFRYIRRHRDISRDRGGPAAAEGSTVFRKLPGRLRRVSEPNLRLVRRVLIGDDESRRLLR